MRFWTLASRREVARFEMKSVINSIPFAPDGSAMFVSPRESGHCHELTLETVESAIAVTDWFVAQRLVSRWRRLLREGLPADPALGIEFKKKSEASSEKHRRSYRRLGLVKL